MPLRIFFDEDIAPANNMSIEMIICWLLVFCPIDRAGGLDSRSKISQLSVDEILRVGMIIIVRLMERRSD